MTASFTPLASVLPEVPGNNSDVGAPKKFTPPVPKPVELDTPVVGTLPAIQEIDDEVSIGATTQSAADLQALLEKLKEAKGGTEISEALHGLQDFINKNTNAGFTGGLLEKLATLADTVLQELDKDPGALNNVTSFGFSFSFSQTEKQAGNAYSQRTSFSFSLNLNTDDTTFHAEGSFKSSLQKTANTLKYSSEEYAAVSIRTSVTVAEDNPLLQAFNELSDYLQNVQAPQLLAPTEEITPPLPKPAQLVGLLGSLRAQFAALDDASRFTNKALDILQDVLEKLRERFALSQEETPASQAVPPLENAAAA